MSKTGTLADREEILREHLPYEIEMLRFAHGKLQEPAHDRTMVNCLIECFCVHARNLIDFFDDDKKDNDKDAVARHFVNRVSYQPFAGSSPKHPGGRYGELYAKLNKQITHITYDRTGIGDADKIGDQDRKQIRRLIEKEIDNFRHHPKEPLHQIYQWISRRFLLREVAVIASIDNYN
jgi:hypothetical protein